MYSQALPALPVPVEALSRGAATLIRSAKTENTRRAYDAAWTSFTQFADAATLPVVPASVDTVTLWLASLAARGQKTSTLRARLAAVAACYADRGEHLDTGARQLRDLLAGHRRTPFGRVTRKRALLTDEIVRMAVGLDPRDRALILFGFAGAFRRIEIVRLRKRDIAIDDDGALVSLWHAKTDADNEGQRVFISRTGTANCPVAAVEAWLAAGGAGDDDRVFAMSDRRVARLVKRQARKAGIDPAEVAGHSLRAGCITSASLSGHELLPVMQHARHKSPQTTAIYVRVAEQKRNALRLGL